MSVILILIIASLLVAGGFLIAYIWAVRTGQYDDKYTPSVRILFEDLKNNAESAKKMADKLRTQNEELKNDKQNQK